ncbi:hypothetical protein KAR91_60030, partial [Candidatus Pacearchaeota archaeon]|nr:hypothetical protein [Candidatus Pacearchaeota archaeon]
MGEKVVCLMVYQRTTRLSNASLVILFSFLALSFQPFFVLRILACYYDLVFSSISGSIFLSVY